MKSIYKELKSGIAGLIQFILTQPLVWLAASFMDENGKTSGSRLTAWFLTMLTGFYAYSDKIKDQYTFYAFAAMLVAVLLLWGIITIKDINSITDKINQNDKE